jgi:hypothetical protein
MTTIADYRAEVLRFETIIKGKDAALSGMKADNEKLSQEIANREQSWQNLVKECYDKDLRIISQNEEIAELKAVFRPYYLDEECWEHVLKDKIEQYRKDNSKEPGSPRGCQAGHKE